MQDTRGVPARKIAIALVAPLLLLVLLGMPSCSSLTLYGWGSTASRGSKLYLIEETTQSVTVGLPIPERPQPRAYARSIRIVSLDLRGSERLEGVGNAQAQDLDGEQARSGYVLLDERGQPSLHLVSEIMGKMKRAIPKPCSGEIEEDQQDSRVLYYVCRDEFATYRFDQPFDRAIPIALGKSAALPDGVTRFEFFAVAGDSKMYLRGHDSAVYEIDTAGDSIARRLEDESRLGKQLIGITPTLRLYETRQDETGLEVRVERKGEEPRTFLFKDPVLKEWLGSRRYLATSERIIWHFRNRWGTEPIVSLDLATGEYQKAKLVYRH